MYAAVTEVILSAELLCRIPPNALRRPKDKELCLYGLCGGAAENELFIARDNQPCVRAFNVRDARVGERDVFRPPKHEKVMDVAYCKEFEVLLIASFHFEAGVCVRSVARSNADNEWTVAHRMQMAREGLGRVHLRVLPDGTIFCGQEDFDGMYTGRLLPDYSMEGFIRMQLPRHKSFDIQKNSDERLLAAALMSGDVALFRVEAERAIELSRISLSGARDPLFCGDTLLVGVETESHVREAVSLVINGCNLKRDRQLIAHDARLSISAWRFAGGKLYAWDYMSKELLDYNCCYS